MAGRFNDEGDMQIEKDFLGSTTRWIATSYVLFIIFSVTFYIFSAKISYINLENEGIRYVVFASSFIIPYEIIGVKLVLNMSKDISSQLDIIFEKNYMFYRLLLGNSVKFRGELLYILLLIGLPLIALSWNGFEFSQNTTCKPYEYIFEGCDPFYLIFDIFYNIFLIFSIILACIIITMYILVYTTYHHISKEFISHIDKNSIFIFGDKLSSIRDYFLKLIVYYISCMSLLNITLFGFIDKISFSAVFMVLLFLLGTSLAYMGLVDTQRIIDSTLKYKLEVIKDNLERTSKRLVELALSEDPNEDTKVERLQKIIELQRGEWDECIKQKKEIDIWNIFKQAGALIITVVIPIISFIISLMPK